MLTWIKCHKNLLISHDKVSRVTGSWVVVASGQVAKDHDVT